MARGGRLPVIEQHDLLRPMNRSQCRAGARPCPWVSCRYHLLVDVGDDGRLLVNHPDGRKALEDVPQTLASMAETCALDVADRGATDAPQIAKLLNVSRERVHRVIEGVKGVVDPDDFDEREHPEDPYIRYMNLGTDELAEIAAILKARQKGKP